MIEQKLKIFESNIIKERENIIRKELEKNKKLEIDQKTKMELEEKMVKELKEKEQEKKEEKSKKIFKENNGEKEEINKKNLQENKNKNEERNEKISEKWKEKMGKKMHEKIEKESEEKKKRENEDTKERLIYEKNLMELEELIRKQKEEKKRKELEGKNPSKLQEKDKKELVEKKNFKLEENNKIDEKEKTITNYLIMPEENSNYIKNEINRESNNKNLNILNEDNKTKLFDKELSPKNEEPANNIFKNVILKKIQEIKDNKNLSEKDNFTGEENQQKKENTKNKKENHKLIKSIELSDIIKNANLFLSDKNNESISNLIQKFEYTNAIDKIIQNEIIENKDNNLITPDEAVYYIENNIIRFYGYFGSELMYRNINTLIEKTPTNEILRQITFKILTSGLAFNKVFKLNIENKELKSYIDEDENIFNIYFEELKKEISKQFNVLEKDIFYLLPDINNYEQYMIIYDNDNNKIKGLEDLLKSENLNFSKNLLLNNIILSPCIFEENFCKSEKAWPKKKSRRGGREYIPPLGWIGISLKVSQKFEKNMTWLGKRNINGEWIVAYHAIGNGNLFNRILDILDGNLKNEETKLFKKDKNIGKNKDKFPLCGEGLYCCPNIQDVEKFTDKRSLGIYNIKFQFSLMTRVNPIKIKNPGIYPVCWILSGNDEEIRPYRLLFKICAN